jgi:hypothetical protein
MAVTLEDRVEIPDTVVFRDLDGEVVILDLESSTYFGLDPVGTRMWTLIGEHGSLGKVYEVLQEEYDVDSTKLQSDLLQLTNQFCERGLARLVSPQINAGN